MCDHGRVFVVGYDDSADAFGAAVGVECVFWGGLEGSWWRWVMRTFLFDVLSLAGPCALGDFASEECQLRGVSSRTRLATCGAA